MCRKPGDFFATHIGRQPVFVVRKPDGTLGCYLNACGHRGATLVTARIGNTHELHLPVSRLLLRHGGQMHGGARRPGPAGPRRTSTSPSSISRRSRGSTAIAASCSAASRPTCPTCASISAAATALIDIFVAPAPQELEIVAGFSVYQTACNWKIMHENGPDAYHAPVVHNNFAQAVNYREKRESPHRRRQDRHRPAHRPYRVRQATISATATPRSGTSAATRRRSRSTRRRRRWRSGSRPASSNGFSAAAAT